jgi:UDP:flavonoid glycosyltransferase YjiC (YdhE family)
VRVLLSTTSGAGHFRPLLPLAQALREAGHELACAAPVESADMVSREGLRHFAFDGVPPDDPDRLAVLGQLPTLPIADAERLMGAEVFGRLNTTAALPGADAAVTAYRPDLVVHEAAESSVRLAAATRGIPSLAVNPSLTTTAYVTAMAAGIADLRRTLGLDPDPDGKELLTAPAISWFPASFDVREAADYDIRRYRDPSAAPPSPDADRDLVFVTLGSEAAGTPFFADAIRAIASGAVEAGLPVLVATGRPVEPGLLADIDGVRVETWVDQSEVMRRARVVVCHAGAGTTLAALVAGVPIVAVPLFADQPYNAASIERLGVGRRLSPGPTLRDDVAAATKDLAASAPAGCREVAAQIAALPPIADAVPWLEALCRAG